MSIGPDGRTSRRARVVGRSNMLTLSHLRKQRPNLDDLKPLLNQARAGDVSAFEQILRRFQDMAVAYSCSLLGDFHLAEDAAQAAFVDAYRNIASLRDAPAFVSWFRTILFKHCDRIRRARTSPATSHDAPLSFAAAAIANDPGPPEAAERRENADAVIGAVCALPENEREVVILFYMNEQRQRQVAEFLGITEAVVNNRLASARRKLKTRMLKMVEDDLGGHRPSRDEVFAQQVAKMLKAAGEGDSDSVRALLSEDARLTEARDVYDKTPLHLAAEKNHAEIAGILLEAGANLEQLTTWGMTPLEWAANMNSRAVADKLIAAGARLNMWSAAGLGMPETVAAFFGPDDSLRDGAAQTRNKREPGGKWVAVPAPTDRREIISDAFYIASRNGHAPVAQFLLDKGADIDTRGFFGAPGLHWAAMNGHKETVELLLSRGADSEIHDTQFNSNAVGWAIEGEHGEIVDVLLARGAQISLVQACALGRAALVEKLLDASPARLNLVHNWGAPIHNATLWGRLDVVQLLLDRGADVNLKNSEGMTALQLVECAVQGGQTRPPVRDTHTAILALLRNRQNSNT